MGCDVYRTINVLQVSALEETFGTTQICFKVFINYFLVCHVAEYKHAKS